MAAWAGAGEPVTAAAPSRWLWALLGAGWVLHAAAKAGEAVAAPLRGASGLMMVMAV